ncbi:hypothetical protein IW146_007255 [Coemansia sp. RSA 922]|nr:hypothetical protein H4S03_001072 [Coemansia sp. S3946]KAJ2095459.1 hypothetical protein GGI09_004862 [Coemansia sp. S100]KAJ2103294.1 hypothetical protein GGI16_003014 [Coemansia sp. S142-1]KAJ2107561.1 hypothetical protein IW146_007255 [Coemansia sp. RSA 922]
MASTFQKLPGFILKKICQYTTLRHADHRKPSGVDESFRFTYRTDLFNSLCQEWTEVASELYFKDYSIDIRGDLNTVSGAHTLNTLDVPVTSIIPFAKVVYVDLDLVDIISGKALTLLKNSLYSAATFPIARTVHFNFTNNNSSDNGECVVEQEKVAENLICFIDALKPMFPRQNKIRIVPGVADSTIQNNIYAGFVQFVELMGSHHKQSSIEVSWPTHVSQSPIVVTGLSSIDITKPRNVGLFEALLHRNASTLKSLNIVNTPSETIINIFETSDGDPVAYPVLKKLVLTSMNKVPKPKYSLEDSPVLLPKLVDLSVKWGHPFHDDVLFRGNNATLEQAILMLDTEFMAVLNKFKVFGQSNRPRLQHVTVWNDPLSSGDKVEQGRLFSLFALDMASKVPSLILQSRFPAGVFVDGIMQQPAIHNLRCLKLINATLSFGTLLTLIESLPNLHEIAIMKLSPEQKYSEMTPRILLEHLHTSYYPLSNQLQYVKYFAGNMSSSMEHDTLCSMLLALLCPRFTRFVVCGWLRKKYNRSIRKAIRTEPFINYADRLSRLAFSDVGENNMSFKAKPLDFYKKSTVKTGP